MQQYFPLGAKEKKQKWLMLIFYQYRKFKTSFFIKTDSIVFDTNGQTIWMK